MLITTTSFVHRTRLTSHKNISLTLSSINNLNEIYKTQTYLKQYYVTGIPLVRINFKDYRDIIVGNIIIIFFISQLFSKDHFIDIIMELLHEI